MARQVAVYVAAVVAFSGRYVDARTCSRSGAQLQAGFSGYTGDSGHPGLLPGGKTYCDVPDGAVQALCDSCPQACINIETSIRVVHAQKQKMERFTVEWDMIETDVLSGCQALQVTCSNPSDIQPGTWTNAVFPPYPGPYPPGPTTNCTYPRAIELKQQGGAPGCVGNCVRDCDLDDNHPGAVNYPVNVTLKYCDWCQARHWGLDHSGTARRLLAAPAPGRRDPIIMHQDTLLAVASLMALEDCTVSSSEIASNPQAKRLAQATLRHKGRISALHVPGCGLTDTDVSQTLEGKRRVTVTSKFWNSLAPSALGVLPVQGAMLSDHAAAMAESFRLAGCGQFHLIGSMCQKLQVVALEEVSSTSVDVTVHALLRLPAGNLIVEVELEAQGSR